jgi:hypothetical protein
MAETAIENGGTARKPWATPAVIVSERVRNSAKTTPDNGDGHVTAPGSPTDSHNFGDS